MDRNVDAEDSRKDGRGKKLCPNCNERMETTAGTCPTCGADMHQTMRMLEGDGHIIEAVKDTEGHEGREWDVILIASGLSKNGNYYPPETLQRAVPLFEGASAFADHATDDDRRTRPERSVRDKVGTFRDVTFGQHEVGGRVVEGVRARFRVVAPWLRETLKEAVAAGEPDFLGFSIDAEGTVSRKQQGGRLVTWVEAINRVASVDVVTDPAAGGRVMRLVASAGGTANDDNRRRDVDPEELKALIAAQVRDAVTGAVAALQEAATPAPVVTGPKTGAPDLVAEVAALKESNRQAATVARVERALTAVTTLSEVGARRLRESLIETAERREIKDDEIQARVQEALDHEAALLQQYANPSSVTRRIIVGDGSHDQMEKALQGWFAGAPVDGVKPFRSLQEAYCQWTGVSPFDLDVVQFAEDFSVKYDSRRDHARIRESFTTASWGQVFADVLYFMMLKDYREASTYDRWRLFVSEFETVSDFRTRHWGRVGGYGDLAAVSEGATYQPMVSFGDEEVTYSIGKRGGLDDATLEMLVDGRSDRMRHIPRRMSRAAKRTMFKFFMNLLTTDNPTMGYDSLALYHATHGNTGTTALSVAGLEGTQIAMRDQAAFGESSEILGERNRIKFLIVPNELEARAERIVNPSDGYTFALSSTPDADTSMDPARFKGKGIQAVVYDQLTDANDWFAVADPSEMNVLVAGALNGQWEPELFVQDSPTAGSNFTADRTTFKVRHIYGGAVADHRGVYRQVVT